MSEDVCDFFGNVRVPITVTGYRSVPKRIYDIEQALYRLNDIELDKVARYIGRVTQKRVVVYEKSCKVNKKKLFAAMRRIDKKGK